MRDQKAALLKAVRPLDPGAVVRGQYRGYRSVPGVRPDSTVETYIALRLAGDSWRWAGVPAFIRAGKCMPRTVNEVTVKSANPPIPKFGETVPAGYGRVRPSPAIFFV